VSGYTDSFAVLLVPCYLDSRRDLTVPAINKHRTEIIPRARLVSHDWLSVCRESHFINTSIARRAGSTQWCLQRNRTQQCYLNYNKVSCMCISVNWVVRFDVVTFLLVACLCRCGLWLALREANWLYVCIRSLLDLSVTACQKMQPMLITPTVLCLYYLFISAKPMSL